MSENRQFFDRENRTASVGFASALVSPLFLGLVPILAKLAFNAGIDVMTLVVVRTILAALVLWLFTFFFYRKLIISSTPAILSSMLAGGINGFGSIFFYYSLTRIDASLGQLVNITYLVFVTMLLRVLGQRISGLTFIRTALAIFAIFLLTYGGLGQPDWIGVGAMVIGAMSYAIQLVLGQRILLDVPAQTMTLYAMTGMALVVIVGWFFVPIESTGITAEGLAPLLWLGVITAASRLTLFLGVKHLGSLQTALLGMLEVVVTIGVAFVLLGETLTLIQWVAAGIIVASVVLVRYEKDVPKVIDWWAMLYMRWNR